MKKVKIIGNDTEEHLEKEINDFIKDKNVIDIKYTQAYIGYENSYMSALIIYEELKERNNNENNRKSIM